MVLLQVPFAAVMLCGRGRDRGRGGGCSRNNGQDVLDQAVVVTVIVIGAGDLTRASCHRNMRLCKQEGMCSCAFIVSTRHMQVQLGNGRL